MARPSKILNETVRATIIASLEAGKYKHMAAADAGIHRDTLLEWEKRGRSVRARVSEGVKVTRTDRLYADFLYEMELADAVGESALFNRVVDLATKGQKWGAAMTILERRWPDRWAPRQRIDHGNADGKPLKVTGLDFARLNQEERATLRELLGKVANQDVG